MSYIRTAETREKQSKAMTRHGLEGTPTYHCWTAMNQRCYNPKHPYYADYGGRGITVCARWRHSFENFLDDMGLKPGGLTLDRRDNSLGYSPGNCRWATWQEQALNRRPRKMLGMRAVFDESHPDHAEAQRRLALIPNPRNDWDD